MTLTWKLILCLFGKHDSGEWQKFNAGVEEQRCRRCDSVVGLRAITNQPRDY